MRPSVIEVLTSSGSEEWATPQYVIDYLSKYFGPFDLDVAATAENAKAPRFFTAEDNGLEQPWECESGFCNPPFNREKKMYVDPWVARAVDETKSGNARRMTQLLPARTGNKWFHEYVFPFARYVYFVQGRIKFEQPGKDNSATFPSIVVQFEHGNTWKRPEFRSMRIPK